MRSRKNMFWRCSFAIVLCGCGSKETDVSDEADTESVAVVNTDTSSGADTATEPETATDTNTDTEEVFVWNWPFIENVSERLEAWNAMEAPFIVQSCNQNVSQCYLTAVDAKTCTGFSFFTAMVDESLFVEPNRFQSTGVTPDARNGIQFAGTYPYGPNEDGISEEWIVRASDLETEKITGRYSSYLDLPGTSFLVQREMTGNNGNGWGTSESVYDFNGEHSAGGFCADTDIMQGSSDGRFYLQRRERGENGVLVDIEYFVTDVTSFADEIYPGEYADYTYSCYAKTGPSWSSVDSVSAVAYPDSSFAYVVTETGADLERIDVITGERTPLGQDLMLYIPYDNHRMSSDYSRILAQRGSWQDGWSIFVVDTSGGGVTPLSDMIANGLPDYSAVSPITKGQVIGDLILALTSIHDVPVLASVDYFGVSPTVDLMPVLGAALPENIDEYEIRHMRVESGGVLITLEPLVDQTHFFIQRLIPSSGSLAVEWVRRVDKWDLLAMDSERESVSRTVDYRFYAWLDVSAESSLPVYKCYDVDADSLTESVPLALPRNTDPVFVDLQ